MKHKTLSNAINWDYFDNEYAKFYSDKDRPVRPFRLMTSLLILKSIANLLDECLVEEHWEMNPYFQYFGGATIQR
ncbi:MAG: transposase [Flavobacteriaceae bacterium]|nr:transposase [Flavobacteriaceae bacterium]